MPSSYKSKAELSPLIGAVVGVTSGVIMLLLIYSLIYLWKGEGDKEFFFCPCTGVRYVVPFQAQLVVHWGHEKMV